MKERDRTIIISNQVCDPEIENTRLVEGRIFFGNTEKWWHLHQKLVKSLLLDHFLLCLNCFTQSTLTSKSRVSQCQAAVRKTKHGSSNTRAC